MSSNSCRHAVITGASAGIGYEFALALHESGYRVTLIARRRERLEELAASLNAKRPDSAAVLVADLTKVQSVDGTLGLGDIEQFLRSEQIDLLVNNAGRGSFGYFEQLNLDSEVEMIALNVTAPLRLAHAVVPQMKARNNGAIIAVSSIAGIQSVPYLSTYSATKAFNLHHSMALRYELKRFGVRVITVCPGPTATEFQGVSRLEGKLTGGKRDSAREVVRLSLIALERNSAYVVTGWRAWFMVLPSFLLPRGWATTISERIMRTVLPSTSIEI